MQLILGAKQFALQSIALSQRVIDEFFVIAFKFILAV